ncbi:hypothetical protein CDEF62S_04708 [Castellaniella defragrans]
MTVLYLLGTLVSFYANRRFTFQHDGSIGLAGVRYLLVYLAGYLLNFMLLLLFVDWLAFPYQIVQGVAIVAVALFLFALLRSYVFSQRTAVHRKLPP